jgi:long-chain acyl-CoA synthetase
VFRGYLDDPEATRAVLADGWLRTGDVGTLDEHERLAIVDRVKDVIITSSGHAVAPRSIEHRLVSSRYVRTAVVIGEGRPHLGALIEIDDGAVGEWAGEHDVPYTTGATLRIRPEVRELVGDVIEQVNDELAKEERIGGFALLPDGLDADTGVLTATAKVRRHEITTRYADLVEGMFE